MKRKFLMLFIGSGLLGTEWSYGYAPTSEIIPTTRSPDYIKRSSLFASQNLYNEFNRLIRCINKFKQSLDDVKPDKPWIWEHSEQELIGTKIKQAKRFAHKLIAELKPDDIVSKLQMLQVIMENHQEYIDPVHYNEFKDIYNTFQPYYKYYKSVADLKILFQLNPTMWPSQNFQFPSLKDLNPDEIQGFIDEYFGIVGRHDNSELSQHILDIENAFAQISPDYNPDNFEQAVADLESLKTRFRSNS